MDAVYDIIGVRFHRLIPHSLFKIRDGVPYYHCICDCGSPAIVARPNLLSGNTKSCGCIRREFLKECNRKYKARVVAEKQKHLSLIKIIEEPAYISEIKQAILDGLVFNDVKKD